MTETSELKKTIELKEENKEARLILLYFLELHLLLLGRPVYFSKGNITVAKQIADFCREYEINEMFYTFLCVERFRSDINKVGFRFMGAQSYKSYVVDRLLDNNSAKRFGVGTFMTDPTTTYDRVRREYFDLFYNKKFDKIDVINWLCGGQLNLRTFLYMMRFEVLNSEEYLDILQSINTEGEATSIAQLMKQMYWRRILPQSVDMFHKYDTFREWVANAE